MALTDARQARLNFQNGDRANREIAALLGTSANGVRQPGSDVPRHAWIAGESKTYAPATYPGGRFLRIAMGQAERARDVDFDRSGLLKLAAVVLHPYREDYRQSLFIVRLQDGVKWLGLDRPVPPLGHPEFRR